MSKLDYKHVPSQLLDGAAESLAYGNTKYGEGKKRDAKSSNDRYNSLIGHLQDWNGGESNDPGSGLSHLKHAAMQLAFLMEAEVEIPYGADGDGRRDYWITRGALDCIEVWAVKPEYEDCATWVGPTDGGYGGLIDHGDWPEGAEEYDWLACGSCVKVRL